MNKQELKKKFDEYVLQHEIDSFVEDDPVQFPKRFNKKQDIEISGLIASSLAFGQRTKIIEAVEKIHNIIDNDPYNFCLNYSTKEEKLFSGFKYRFKTGEDMMLLFEGLAKVLKKYNSLEDLFLAHHNDKNETIKEGLAGFISEILPCPNSLMPCPTRKSACKRMNLYLKWMVRKSAIDLGIWNGVSPSKLIIPLDVHVAKQSRKYGILSRKQDDWQSAYEITKFLSELDPHDPIKYDVVLFGEGIGL